MTQEEKQLLLIDLCARLPYGVIIRRGYVEFKLHKISDERINDLEKIEDCKPYLRPMSSMTDEERTKIASTAGNFNDLTKAVEICFASLPIVDYCYSRHLDIHGLIEKGLALEAPEGMYKTE